TDRSAVPSRANSALPSRLDSEDLRSLSVVVSAATGSDAAGAAMVVPAPRLPRIEETALAVVDPTVVPVALFTRVVTWEMALFNCPTALLRSVPLARPGTVTP